MRFPGEVFDKETNNHYNYFRDYDPQTGRYVQSDPIGLTGINTYSYAGGNPLSNFDATGLEIVPIGTNSEKARIRKGLDDLAKASPTVAKMIASLRASSCIYTIEVGSEKDHYGVDKNDNPRPRNIVWNPNLTQVGDGSKPWQTRSSFIGLGHELIHAYAEDKGFTPQGDTVRDQLSFDEY
jgi:RHS repeat-associated protein